MTSLFDKLNLRPQERRLVVIVVGVVFVVINFWLVWPHFGDLGKAQQRTTDARTTLAKFQVEIKRSQEYTNELKRLADQGQVVAADSQALELMKEVSSMATLSGVQVQRYDSTPRSRSGGRTNAFFEEQSLIITVNTGEKELIEFLWNLASRNSLIRVRSMTLQPDAARMRLSGNITLVESFQKKAPPKAPGATAAASAKAPPPPKTAPPPKPADTPVKVIPAKTTAPAPVKTPEPPARTKESPKRTPPPPPPPQATPPSKP